MTAPLPPQNAIDPVKRRRAVTTVLLVIFIDLLGFGIVLPLLPYVSASYDMPRWMSETFLSIGVAPQYLNAVAIGLISFAFNLMMFIFSPVWGRLSDIVGRKPILTISMLGYTGSWILWIVAPDLTWLIAGRALAGIFAANIAAAQAYMADVYPPNERSKGMGLVGAAFGLGFTLGPALGAGLSWLGDKIDPGMDGAEHGTLGLHLPMWVAAGLSFTAFLLAAFKLPESLPKEMRGRATKSKGRIKELLHAVKQPVMGNLLVGFFTVTFGFAVLEQLYSEFNRDILKYSKSVTAIVFSLIGLVIVVVQGGLIGRLTKRFGAWNLLLFGICIEGGTLAVFGYVDAMWLLIPASAAMAFGSSLCTPSTLALVSAHTPPDQQGGAMGLASAASGLGRMLGPLLGAAVWGFYGAIPAFMTGGIIVLLAFPFVWHARKASPIKHVYTRSGGAH
jgi:DHA1 family tetracycline resistance protein-like MFS transporter